VKGEKEPNQNPLLTFHILKKTGAEKLRLSAIKSQFPGSKTQTSTKRQNAQKYVLAALII
jgi:hypothetical protein